MNAQPQDLPVRAVTVPDCARIDAAQLALAKWAFTTRRVPVSAAHGVLSGAARPQPGDLALARVIRLGQHRFLQSPNGRRQNLFVDDEIVAVFGHRYAPDQFEALVPDALGPCHLVASGGVISTVRVSHARMGRPTEVLALGLLADAQGAKVNISRFRLGDVPGAGTPAARVVAVLGTSMNSGKTTVAANLIRGLKAAGLSVGAAKVTGTGACGDGFHFTDAGARPVLDFLDFGYTSTYQLGHEEVEQIFRRMMQHLDAAGVDVVVLEIADGLYQSETAALVQQPAFRARVDGIVFAAADSMGAAAGVEWLERRGIPVIAVGGVITAAPLAVREARRATRLPVISSAELSSAVRAQWLMDDLDLRRTAAQAQA